MRKEDRKRIDREMLERAEWLLEDAEIQWEQNKAPKQITYGEVREYMLNFKQELAEERERIVILDSFANLIIKAIDKGYKKDFSYYLDNLYKFVAELEN